jgi:hypothetical protein
MKVGLASARHQEVRFSSYSGGARFRHQKCATVHIDHYLVSRRAFSETEERNYFPDRPNVGARVIVLGALCLLPRHDNDPDGNSPNSASVLLSEVPIN